MKKYIAISCLLGLLLTGCKKAEEPKKTAPQPTVAVTEAITETQPSTLPEQIVPPAESKLTGCWEGVISMGDTAAKRFLPSIMSEDQIAQYADAFSQVTYPVFVQLDLNEDGTYYYELKIDNGIGFASFVSSFHRTLEEQGITDYTEDQLREMMVGAGSDQLSEQLHEDALTGTWEENDQGLVLSEWCTVQFTIDGAYLVWDRCDDPEFAEMLPIEFRPA